MTFVALLVAVATLLLLAGIVMPPAGKPSSEKNWELCIRELRPDGGDLICALPEGRRYIFGTGPLPHGLSRSEGCPWARAVTLSKSGRHRFPRGPFGRALLLVPSATGVLLISAGANGKIETDLGQTKAEGDDLVHVLVHKGRS